MKKLPHILLALVVSAVAAAILSTVIGRIFFLSNRDEATRLGLILFAISTAIWMTLIFTIHRKG